MSVACFIRSVDSVVNAGNDTFTVTILCNLMDTSNSVFTVSFDAAKGSDWRIQARTAVASHALTALGETVDLVVLPSLETI